MHFRNVEHLQADLSADAAADAQSVRSNARPCWTHVAVRDAGTELPQRLSTRTAKE